jgi:type I restriction enzyme M protein
MGKEGEIREKILGMDLLEAVIGLGANLFYGTGLAACILIFRQRKAKDRKNKVLIVDASKEFKTGRAQNELLPEHVERIFQWYRKYQNVTGIARVVTLDEIAANDHNLNIPRYVEPKNDQVDADGGCGDETVADECYGSVCGGGKTCHHFTA